MNNDIVERLRRDRLSPLCELAADEIERLREALRIEQEELVACCIDRKETQRERDEARREVCYLTAELDMINHTSVTAESIALEYEWDCFKNM